MVNKSLTDRLKAEAEKFRWSEHIRERLRSLSPLACLISESFSFAVAILSAVNPCL
jgi:hypothetical protein